jgi:hypothetical protein
MLSPTKKKLASTARWQNKLSPSVRYRAVAIDGGKGSGKEAMSVRSSCDHTDSPRSHAARVVTGGEPSIGPVRGGLSISPVYFVALGLLGNEKDNPGSGSHSTMLGKPDVCRRGFFPIQSVCLVPPGLKALRWLKGELPWLQPSPIETCLHLTRSRT